MAYVSISMSRVLNTMSAAASRLCFWPKVGPSHSSQPIYRYRPPTGAHRIMTSAHCIIRCPAHFRVKPNRPASAFLNPRKRRVFTTTGGERRPGERRKQRAFRNYLSQPLALSP
jgi:hypothetical protein